MTTIVITIQPPSLDTTELLDVHLTKDDLPTSDPTFLAHMSEDHFNELYTLAFGESPKDMGFVENPEESDHKDLTSRTLSEGYAKTAWAGRNNASADRVTDLWKEYNKGMELGTEWNSAILYARNFIHLKPASETGRYTLEDFLIPLVCLLKEKTGHTASSVSRYVD